MFTEILNKRPGRFFSRLLAVFFSGLVLFWGICPVLCYGAPDHSSDFLDYAEQDLFGASDSLADPGYDQPAALRTDERFYRAKVLEIMEERSNEVHDWYIEEIQTLRIRITGGDRKGEEVVIDNGGISGLDWFQKYQEGDRVVLLSHRSASGDENFYINDYNRINGLLLVFLVFFAIVLYFGRKRGLGSIMGLGFSILVLANYIVPKILEGSDPLRVTLAGAILIASVSLFLSHGLNKRTPIMWLSTVVTLMIALFVSNYFVDFVNLFGRGSEAGLALQFGQYAHINLRGLLMAGIVIGVLGVLDDVTATQTAVVWELKQANPSYGLIELYRKSLNVGREHIASLVNTLALAYVGASLPIFILLRASESMPLWLKINNEIIAEEIIRTIVGSTALVLAVPIASLFAAFFISRMKGPEKSS